MTLIEQYNEQKKKLEDIRNKILEILKPHGVNSIETYVVMDAIHQYGDLTQSAISNLTGVVLGTVGNIILNLEKKNLITNETDLRDFSKRTIKRKLVNLTPEGLEILKACKAKLSETNE